MIGRDDLEILCKPTVTLIKQASLPCVLIGLGWRLMFERKSNYDMEHNKILKSHVSSTKVFAVSFLLLILASCSFFNKAQSNAGTTLTQISNENGQTSVEAQQGNTTATIQDEKQGTVPRDAEKLKKINSQLLEEAQREQTKVNDSEVTDVIKANLEHFGITNEQLELQLKNAGLTYDEFREKVKSQIEISTLINSKVNLSQIVVSDDEIGKYIDDNKQDFQDFLQNEQNLAILKVKVKSLLLKQKQSEAVMSYVKTLG